MKLIDAEPLENILRTRCAQYSNDYGNLAGAISGCLKLVQAQPTIASPPNDPLNISQLRKMDGEPVFIKCLFNDDLSSYVVVDKPRDSNGIFTRLFYASFDYYGDEWLAYRRRPEEG